ncbi:hypothetical protein [Chitinophaga nivalis]|uniref:Uncharacterized protein n=1 Tax=Chitinophaga nivalis TaxID=2991709 RepID=A0ABT3IFB9_9BACT|nr:hypothetical protein [Chitinophaga nivalis]MCW3467652.1 hypothetical protein [Chitinophaga nivalis]MCW3482656.1 hypothetical protein [Chitinophaga nivalis]
MHDDGQPVYWFYHKESFPVDPPLLYQQLIAGAKSFIEIWNPYFNVPSGTPGDAIIFTSVQLQVTIKLLTQKGMTRGNPYLQAVENAMQIVIPASRQVRFGLRVVNKSNTTMENWWFHDRMLIIDKTNFYLVEAPIGHHISVQGSTGIYSVKDHATQSFMRQLFDIYWLQASNCEIAVKNLYL